MITQTKETQANITPEKALQILKEGNERFVNNSTTQRDFPTQVESTQNGQFPFAAVLSCIDSRVPAEIVFDQGIGDLFSARVAGNIVNEDVLGSLEYACKVAGSKIIVVLGHTKCGAVTAACNKVELGNITALLDKIQPSVQSIHPSNGTMTEQEIEVVSVENVKHSIDEIKQKSPILAEMAASNEISIVGGLYNVATGKVSYLDHE